MISLWEVLGSRYEGLGAELSGLWAMEKASLSSKIDMMQNGRKCREEACWLLQPPEYVSNRQVSKF